jgi:hypothetical protein
VAIDRQYQTEKQQVSDPSAKVTNHVHVVMCTVRKMRKKQGTTVIFDYHETSKTIE